MKIVIVTPYFYPKIGGLEMHTYHIAKGLKKRGHAVTVVTTQHEKKLKSVDSSSGIKVIRLKPMFKISNTPVNILWFFKVRRIIKKEDPDIIEAHSPVVGLADLAYLSRGNRIFVIKYHAGSQKKGKIHTDIFIGFYERYLLKRIFLKSDGVMAVYPQFVTVLIKDRREVAFIPPGVDASKFKHIKKEEVRQTDILFVGRVEKSSEWKGIDLLLEAVKEISQTNREIKLNIVGEGDALNFYKNKTREMNIQKNVIFSGALKGQDLVKAYNNTKVLVLPSKTSAESFGGVLIEAMACETPVVGSNIGGIPNVIIDDVNGYLFKANDVIDLVKSINLLLNNPGKSLELGKYGRAYVKKNFTIEHLVERTEAYLYTLMNPRIKHITPTYLPSIGGVQTVVYQLAKRQHEKGLGVEVVTSNNKASHKRQDDEKFKVTRLTSIKFAHTNIMFGLFRNILNSPKNTILHIHVAQAGIPEVSLLAAKIKKIPIIMHVHTDVERSGTLGYFLPLYKAIFLRNALKYSDCVIALSSSQQELLLRKYKLGNKVAVVPNGVDEAFFINKKFNKNVSTLNLLYVGRLSTEKNVDKVIEAVSATKVPIQFDIVGDGPLRDKLSANVPQEHRKMIKFHGAKMQDEIIDFLKSTDIFILFSDYEGQSLALLEAMATCTPVITSNFYGAKEIVSSRGFVVESSVSELTGLLEKLYAKPEIIIPMINNLKSTRETLGWDRSVNKLTQIYDEIYRR
ncbi:MAG TPA: glycosyltransferase family 4 protein [Candidatus Sulfotelmatobacter sp.]|nr:glycosyltransferase family 4 protein [Candidatus Sulfotelmatobacter sp.]